MKYFNYTLVLFIAASLAGCQLIGTIFKGGVWTGAILVIVVIAGIIALFARSTTKK